MPEFDTRKPPQGPRQRRRWIASAGERLLVGIEGAIDFLVRSLDHRLVRPANGLLSSIKRHRWVMPAVGLLRRMIHAGKRSFIYRHRRWAAGLGLLFLGVGVIGYPWAWHVVGRYTVTHPSYDQLPEYSYSTKDYADCPYVTSTEPEGNIRCFYAITNARDPELLALVTYDVVQDYGMEGQVEQVEFYEHNPYTSSGANERPYATGLVFASKDAAEGSADVISEDLSEATHWHGAYVFEW
jgi:hypothetical protein